MLGAGRWFSGAAGKQGLAKGLAAGRLAPEPMRAERTNNVRLLEAVRRDLGNASGRAAATGVRIAWTGDRLEAARRLQAPIIAAAHDGGPQVVVPVGA